LTIDTILFGLIGHQNELVEWLIEEGKNKNYFDETIETEILGSTDNIEYNEKILEKGINVNSSDNKGKTPLMNACFFGNIEVVRELLERGAEINAKDDYKRRRDKDGQH